MSKSRHRYRPLELRMNTAWYLTAAILQKQHLSSIHPQRRHRLQPSRTVPAKTRMSLLFFPGRHGPSVNTTSIANFSQKSRLPAALLFAFSVSWRRVTLTALPAASFLPQSLLFKIIPPDLPTVSTHILHPNPLLNPCGLDSYHTIPASFGLWLLQILVPWLLQMDHTGSQDFRTSFLACIVQHRHSYMPRTWYQRARCETHVTTDSDGLEYWKEIPVLKDNNTIEQITSIEAHC